MPRRARLRREKRLQFGHGCDAVEISLGQMGGGVARLLQFGHGCDAVEMWIKGATL